MADIKNKEERTRTTEHQVSSAGLDVTNVDATDDFDPFSGIVECVEENIDVALSAPPENQ